MPEQKPSSRPRCDGCKRPVSHCLCAHIPEVANRTPVLILQHPDESKHPLNTGRLATLGLLHAELLVGEYFPQLSAILASANSAYLLFPTKVESQRQPLGALPLAESSLLIVPDGTWRKARKIVHANPILSTLPHLSLPLGEPSAYRVRKAREPAAVSTIEAIVRTLTILEPEQDFQPLLKPFQVLVEQQIQAMGTEAYQRLIDTGYAAA